MKLQCISISLTLACLLQGNALNAQEADVCAPCRTAAVMDLNATLLEIKSGYSRSAAHGAVTEDEEEREEWLEEMREEYAEAYEEAMAQHEARLVFCGKSGECFYDVDLDPAHFMTPEEIIENPNPYWPMTPGTLYRYRGITDEGEEEIIEVRFTGDVRMIEDIPCMVVRDTVWKDGEVAEDTWDWYAQDKEGSVWYFGEITFEYEDEQISGLEGSWETGKDGAKPGYQMPAAPSVGFAYRQELLYTEAEDAAEVLALGQSVQVEYGSFDDCVQTADYNLLDPGMLEHKNYAPGIGFILELKPETGERVELIAVETFNVETESEED